MESNTCKNCKYWERYKQDKDGICSKLIDSLNERDCPNNDMLSSDKWGESGFQTGENFGCIHFENK